MAHGDILIGTAGWSVPARYAGQFPEEGSHLQRYAACMGMAEINSSFYRPHRRATYERWAASTPEDFRFAVKAPRLLTHDQRLADPGAGLDRFAEEIAGLGSKLGVILVQTPPSLGFDPGTAGRFFKALAARIAAPVVVEPRHASWFTAEADDWLVRLRIARVAADPARIAGAGEPGGWRGLTYFRLHGSPRIYYSGYENGFLEDVAARLAKLARRGPAWCVLDNTAEFAALGDAMTLMRKVDLMRGTAN